MADDDDRFRRWVLEQTRRLEVQGWAPGGPREESILRRWRQVRPKIVPELGDDLLVKLAFVLDDQRHQAKIRYLDAGWPPCDAKEEAPKEWLLQAPEDEDDQAAAWTRLRRTRPPHRADSGTLGAGSTVSASPAFPFAINGSSLIVPERQKRATDAVAYRCCS